MKSKAEITITPATLAEAVAGADDFGHEMRVRSLLEHNAGAVTHGWTYIDPVEGKPRQYDIRCALKHHSFPRYLQLAIECKNLAPEAPLIVSGTKRTRREAFHDFVLSDGTVGCRICVMRDDHCNATYPEGEFVGKSVLRFKPNAGKLTQSRDLESEIYNRWTQALASANDLCKQSGLAGSGQNTKVLTAILPIVVIPDGSLWVVDYDNMGNAATPCAADTTTLFLNHEVVVHERNNWMNLTHIHFFTLTGLRLFLATLQNPANTWNTWFSDVAKPHKPPVH